MILQAYSQVPNANFNTECISCTQPNGDPDLLFFTKYWKVVLHPDQSGLGNCLITALRHVPKISELTTEESGEFFQILSVFEPALEKALNATLINISCDRNWAYRKDNPDPPFKNGLPNPHVHWHVAVRYSEPQEFAGIVFKDINFGEPIVWDSIRVSQEVKIKIISKIRGELNIVFE